MKDITFKGIKQSLIDYYSQQDEFKDINFTAPAITTLIDAQAYLAHYLITYANFALNESFLDTAQKRSSVVSKARNIGYYPQQYTCSTATVKMDYIGTSALDDYVVPAGTTFTAINNGTTYYFRSTEPAPVQKTTTGRYWCQLTLREGTEITNRFVQNEYSTTTFILSNPKVDLSTLTVRVYENSSDPLGTEYVRLQNISQFGPEACIYTAEENTAGSVQLVFGDGIISKKIVPGNIVECKYVATSGTEANGIASFQLASIPGGAYDKQLWTVTTVNISNSGADRETIESIKLIAPRFLQRQGRNVIATDYQADIMNSYGELIDAISVWGGENNVPPEYGSVFISIKPKNALALTPLQKERIIASILESSVVGITPKIIDPEILYVNILLNVAYNKLNSVYTPAELKQRIISNTQSFFNNKASSFNIDFRFSKFLSKLFMIDSSINDITAKINLSKYIMPVTNTPQSYIINFKNKIEPGSVFIGPYIVLGESSASFYMEDDDSGTLYAKNDNISEIVGTVDYESGAITIKNYSFKTTDGAQIPVMVSPANNNMKATNNYIFSIDTIDVLLNGE